jgi:hypothetical protein
VPGARETLLFCAWLAWSRFRVVIPVRDGGPAHGDLVHRLRFAGDRRGTDLSTHRQREDDDHRPGHRDRGPPPSSRGRRTPLWPASTHLRPVRSRVQRGGSEATVRIAKTDLIPDLGEPAGEAQQPRRIPRGLRDLLPAGQHPRPPRDRQCAGLRARRSNTPACTRYPWPLTPSTWTERQPFRERRQPVLQRCLSKPAPAPLPDPQSKIRTGVGLEAAWFQPASVSARELCARY